MMKFVSTKPPKGGQQTQAHIEEKPRKKKGSFRWKIFSKREDPQTFDKYGETCDNSEARREKECSESTDQHLGDYDNFTSSRGTDPSQKAPNGNANHSRSWSLGSDSSFDSYRASQSKRNTYDPYRGQGPLRHVTWSPDVTNGDKSSFSFEMGPISSQDSNEHDDYYWDNLQQFNSDQPFKLHHQGPCALNEDGPFYQYQESNFQPDNVSSRYARPSCSRRLEYPRDQFIHHVGKPILENRKFEMYPSVTLPHRSKASTSNTVAANSYATVGPKTLKRDYRTPYSVPISSVASDENVRTGHVVSSSNLVSPSREIPVKPNLMRNYNVPYCMSLAPISSPRELSVNSKLIFSPSIYSTPKHDKDFNLSSAKRDQKLKMTTDYDQLSEGKDGDVPKRESKRKMFKSAQPYFPDDKYLDFIKNVSTRFPQHDVQSEQIDNNDFNKINYHYKHGTSNLHHVRGDLNKRADVYRQGTSDSVEQMFDEMDYDRDTVDIPFPKHVPVMTSCVPQINNHDVKHESVNRYQYSTRDHQISGPPSSRGGMSTSSTLRNMITRAQDHHGNREDDQLVLDLVYITERIISMSFPSDGHETTYQYNLNEVMNMLKQKHGDNCMVINVSEQRPDLQKVNTQRIIDYGWPAHLAPPLERLCNICKSMDSWMNSDPNHVVVVHCKGGQDRIAMVIAAFMHYCNICASSDQAMDRFAMKRFYDDKLAGILRPSQDRYVQYFAGLLSGKIKINSNPLYLHHLVIHGVPNYDTAGGCRPFIKVYQGMQSIFTSGVYNVTDQMQKVCISISPGIPLRGDIMIKCFHKHKSGSREPMWTAQFHTCAISNMNVLFAKRELDEANNDPRFPNGGKVEFVFGKSQDSRVLVHDFKSDVTVPVVDEDGLKRSESYENFLRSGGVTIDGIIGNTSTNQYNTHMRTTEPIQQSYNTSDNTMKSSYSSSSTLPKKTATADEQKELDMILSDLLNDQVFVTSPQSPPKSGYPSSDETRTFRTYDTERGPDGKVTYRTAEVNYKVPEQQSYSYSTNTVPEQQSYSYSMNKAPEQQSYSYSTNKAPEQHSYSYSTKSFNESKSYVPPNAFSYTPASPELARRTESTKTTTLPYSVRTDYDHQNGDQFSFSRSDTDNSWLQQQQQKLRERKDSKSEERQQQERQLVDELRSAQNKYLSKRAQNEADEQAVMIGFQNTSPPPLLSNGPSTGNYSYSMKKTHTFSTEKNPEVITYTPGDSSYTTYQTESRSNKPPPSPGQQRTTNIQINMPVSPPLRSSSKDYMQRSKTSSTSNSWQSSQGQNLYRQNSDSTFDRQSEVILPPVVKTITITTPPPSRRSFSPSNQQNVQKTSSYEVRQTVRDQSPDFSKSLPRYSPTKTKVTEIQETNLPEGDKKSHYITEVYVHRTAGGAPETPVQHHRTKSVERTEKTEIDKTRSLDELEKSLQAASNSIIASKPTWQVQQQNTTAGNQGFQKVEQTQRVTRKYETRTYETHQQQQQQKEFVSGMDDARSMSPTWDNISPHVISVDTQIDESELDAEIMFLMNKYSDREEQRQEVPRPKHINVVEEDRFSLRPIGPGMQPLEPEGIQTSTLPRSTTPSFPVSPTAAADVFDKLDDTNHQQQQQQQQQEVREHREYRYQTQNYNYGQQPGQQQQQQFVTGSHQNVNMVEGMPPQNIPIQHQQGGSQFNTMSSTHGSVSSPQGFNTMSSSHGSVSSPQGFHTLGSTQSPQGFNTLGSNQSYQTQHQEKYHTMGSSGSQDRFGTMGSQNYNTMNSGQQFGTMGSQNGSLHVDTNQRMMHSGPSSAGSPHSPETLNALRQQLHVAHNMSSSSGGALSPGPHSMTGQSSPSVYFGLSRRGSLTSLADNADAVHATPKFVKNTSKYWYMPNITREEAIAMLKDKSPGTFVVRDSNSFPGAFGLALKVATIPPNVQTKSSGDPAADLVRHFLIEPTPKGVRLRGCSNEPVFGSLASLVYQHSITPLALPCKLVLPEVDTSLDSTMDASHTSEVPSSAAALLAQGAACNVLYINSVDTESLTGPQAVARALKMTYDGVPPSTTTVVHFKVSNQGITLTDNQRKLFFRRHYPVSAVTYCGMDPEGRKWKRDADIAGVQLESRVFGFVARKHSGASDNACHLFAELDPEQPASAIVNFVTKIMIGQSSKK